jgi:predicted PurR-regulated permease PerM
LPQNDRFASRAFNLAIVALLGYVLFRIFQPFFGPIVWAFLVSFLLFPVNQRLRRLVGGRAGLAALVLTVGVTLGIVIPVAVGTIAFSGQAVELAQSLTEWANRSKISGVQDILKLPLIGGLMSWLEKNFSVDGAQVQAWAVQAAQGAIQFLLTHGRDVLFGALGLFGDLALMLFVLFFFFRDGDVMAARAKGLIPLDARRKERLDGHLQEVTRAVVFGTVVTALVQGALIGIAFWITGIPSPLVFGAVAAIASFIPLVGTGLVWIPAVIYLYAQGVLWKTIFLAAWSALVAGSADNFLKPMLVSGKAAMSTLTVFVGVLGGLAAFGMVGLFLGPVILALVLTLIEFAEEQSEASGAG